MEKREFPKHESLADTLKQEAQLRDQTLLYAVSSSDKVVGYLLYRKRTLIGHIQKLIVHPDYRRNGIGRKLLRTAIEALKANEIGLYVDVNRTGAINLYQSVGFKIITRRNDYYRPGRDAFYMTTTTGT